MHYFLNFRKSFRNLTEEQQARPHAKYVMIRHEELVCTMQVRCIKTSADFECKFQDVTLQDTHLASSSCDIGIPFRRHVMSIGWSPLASQIRVARSPFRTDSLTDFSLKWGGAGKTKIRH